MRSPRTSTVSIESRVVPGISETITRSRPSSELRRLDLPTFGRPRIATRIASSGSSGRPCAPCSSSDSRIIVEEVAGAVAVQAGERNRVAEAEPVQVERERVLARVVDLVREHEHRPVRLAQDLRDLLVAGRDPRLRVDDEEDEVGLLDGLARLVRDRPRERCRIGDVDAAGVDEQEPFRVPLADELLAVARDAGCLVDDRRARAAEPVHERRLADVREADDRDRADERVGRLLLRRGFVFRGHRYGSVTAARRSAGARGGTATRGRGEPAACRSRSQAQSRCSSRSISTDASR